MDLRVLKHEIRDMETLRPGWGALGLFSLVLHFTAALSGILGSFLNLLDNTLELFKTLAWMV